MTDFPVTVRRARGVSGYVFDDYVAAALTAAAGKKKWVAPFAGRIVDVIIDSGTTGSGGTSNIADVNINGTTIYTTQANRPTLLTGDTGMWTEAAEPEVNTFVAGDIISWDVDQISTTGSADTCIAIICVER